MKFFTRYSGSFEEQREKMVKEQLIPRSIKDERVLKAMGEVPREEFVYGEMKQNAYVDSALPIDEGQTISQPYIVALMIEALKTEPADRILEIGTGSGYAAAVLSQMVKQVYTVELHKKLANQARARYEKLNYNNITVKTDDGSKGWEEKGPFDGIMVSAGAPEVPESLIKQLKEGARLIVPVGQKKGLQKLYSLQKESGDEIELKDLGAVAFVPLRGEEGWDL